MRAVAITIDGVLRKPLDVEAQDTSGALLYASLTDNFRVVVLGGYDRAADEQFLLINGFTRYVQLESLRVEDGRTDDERRTARLRRLRADGFVFEFIVLADVPHARDLMLAGFPIMLYCHPAFTPAIARRPQSWDELAEQVDYSLQARAEWREKGLVK